MTSHADMGAPIDVAIERIFLDPNNPRIAPEPAPGYANTKTIFAKPLQDSLLDKVYEVYKAGGLEAKIVDQGWTPVDPILVWQPVKNGDCIVVEGNTRISVLKRIRLRAVKEEAKLARMRKGGYPALEMRKQTELIAAIARVIKDTAKVRVHPVVAATAVELKAKLPKLLGVRHISPPHNWTPYATNLYVLSLYEAAFAKMRPKAELKLDAEVLDVVAQDIPLKRDEIRKAIQAASAFGHFKRTYEEEVEEAGNRFFDGDQYYFDNILSNPVARDAFGFGKEDLHLSEEGERALYTWAFSKKRQTAGDDENAENANVFEKAEDLRIWQKIARYDAKTGVTNFAKRLSVTAPAEATKIGRLLSEQLAHKEKTTPVKTLDDLVKALKDLKADTLKAQSNVVRPILDEIARISADYLDMISEKPSAKAKN